MGEVWTARISSRDPDRFDVTRQSGGAAGAVFAPSWSLLRPVIEVRRQGGDAEAAWAAYVPAYRVEMLTSWRAHRAAWDALLAQPRVVLVCYCVEPARCHRTLLAGYLRKLGAVDCGELAEATSAQVPLFATARR